MTQPILGLDADTIITPALAAKIKAAGFSYVGRYLKNVTNAEIAAIHAAGLGVWAIFETTTSRSLSGATAGSEDGHAAAQQAKAHGFPDGTAIYATTDMDVSAIQLPVVGAYYAAFAQNCTPYGAGAYASGDVLTYVGKNYAGIRPWLAGAMGWSGSRSYDASGAWIMKQGPDLNGRAGTFAGIPFPALGLDYDPNIINDPERLGAWMPGAPSTVNSPVPPIVPVTPPAPTQPPAAPASPPPQNVTQTLWTTRDLKVVQALLRVTPDGIWGQATEDAFNAFGDFFANG